MRDEEILEEWRNEMRQEAYEEERLEHKLRSDFDFFVEYNEEKFILLNEVLEELKVEYELYGYTFDIKEVLDV